jgi:hypothetical protein
LFCGKCLLAWLLLPPQLHCCSLSIVTDGGLQTKTIGFRHHSSASQCLAV